MKLQSQGIRRYK